MGLGDISYHFAETDADFEMARKLIIEYVEGLGVDLAFQNIHEELHTLRDQYFGRRGCMLLGLKQGTAVACAAFRESDAETAELKRMYVRTGFRGEGTGRQLLSILTEEAMKKGYRRIRLDTLPGMKAAQALYLSAGFREIAAYRFNPVEGTVYLEKILVE